MSRLPLTRCCPAARCRRVRSLRISSIGMGAGFEKRSRTIEGLVHHGVHERRGAFVIDLVEVSTGFEEQTDHVRMRSVVEGTSTIASRHVDIVRPRIEQRRRECARRTRSLPGAVAFAFVVDGAGVGAGGKQPSNELGAGLVRIPEYAVQDSAAFLASRVDLGTCFEEDCDDILRKVVRDGSEQRRVAPVTRGVDVPRRRRAEGAGSLGVRVDAGSLVQRRAAQLGADRLTSAPAASRT